MRHEDSFPTSGSKNARTPALADPYNQSNVEQVTCGTCGAQHWTVKRSMDAALRALVGQTNAKGGRPNLHALVSRLRSCSPAEAMRVGGGDLGGTEARALVRRFCPYVAG